MLTIPWLNLALFFAGNLPFYIALIAGLFVCSRYRSRAPQAAKYLRAAIFLRFVSSIYGNLMFLYFNSEAGRHEMTFEMRFLLLLVLNILHFIAWSLILWAALGCDQQSQRFSNENS